MNSTLLSSHLTLLSQTSNTVAVLTFPIGVQTGTEGREHRESAEVLCLRFILCV